MSLKKKKRERERNRGLFPKKPETWKKVTEISDMLSNMLPVDMPYNTPGSQKP